MHLLNGRPRDSFVIQLFLAKAIYHGMEKMWRFMVYTLYYGCCTEQQNQVFLWTREASACLHVGTHPIICYQNDCLYLSLLSFLCEIGCWGIRDNTSRLCTLCFEQVSHSVIMLDIWSHSNVFSTYSQPKPMLTQFLSQSHYALSITTFISKICENQESHIKTRCIM
jgi:hypothetical protein